MKKILFALILFPMTVLHAEDTSTEPPMLGSLPAQKILFLGNSITLHGPAPKIGWTGNWGMAASLQEKDYVHLLTADIAKAVQSPPKTMVKNIAQFEREYNKYDLRVKLKRELDFKADIVIVAIGENVSELKTDEQQKNFTSAFNRLLALINQQGEPVVFVRSSFWPNKTKDQIMQKVSAETGATFIDISAIGYDKSNEASSERDFEHAGVAAHPGDKGMRAIADALFKAIKKRSDSPAQAD